MPEPIAPEAPVAPVAPVEPAPVAPAADDAPLGENGVKALAAERDARKAAEARIKELEDASKSDEQKRAERFDQLEKSDGEKAGAIGSLESKLLRYQVASAKGLDLEAAERLIGSSQEEIEADADKWIAKWGKSNGPAPVPGAGVRGDGHSEVSPGIDRLRQAYSATSK